MTNEELWQLFPIILSSHDPLWKNIATNEMETILQSLGKENICRINHIGSTAVEGLLAKPTIDILLEITDDCDTKNLIHLFQEAGWLFSPQPKNPAPHMMFMKGYTLDGFRGQAFHLHVRYFGDWGELYFRDYLQSNAEVRREYTELKSRLQKLFEHDRDAYTNAKGPLIQQWTETARQEAGCVYGFNHTPQ